MYTTKRGRCQMGPKTGPHAKKPDLFEGSGFEVGSDLLWSALESVKAVARADLKLVHVKIDAGLSFDRALDGAKLKANGATKALDCSFKVPGVNKHIRASCCARTDYIA